MKNGMLLLVLITMIIACNNGSGSTATNDADTIKPNEGNFAQADTLAEGCYSWIQGKDTATLQIQARGSQVTGSLSYNIFEKDRNDGTVQADLTGDVIRGWYLFKSEGIVSVREVAWKIRGEELWPATGEIKEAGDTARFAQPDRLDFDRNRAFKKVPCVI